MVNTLDYRIVGRRCAEFRREVLEVTLTELCNKTGQNIKNVSAFEHGRANNLKYLFFYLTLCDEEQKRQFAKYVFGGVENGCEN